MTKRPGISLSNDPGIAALFSAKSDGICYVGKASDYHVRVALGVSNEENLDCIRQSIEMAVAHGRETLLDCEHFFDGYKSNREYAVQCAQTALDAGARWVVLCDTNGGTQPGEVHEIVRTLSRTIPGSHLGIHAHDDSGQAVANSFAALEAGVRQIQGTLNGIGERCGNANLITIIPTLVLKENYNQRFKTGISSAGVQSITRISRAFDDIVNRAPNTQAPYVGASAFTTKAGIHASAILKDPNTYEHINPKDVGNQRLLMVSDQGGKSNFISELQRIGIEIDKNDSKLNGLIATVKERESNGYAYEAAQASFEILARRHLGVVPHYFRVNSFRVQVEQRFNALGEIVTISEAVVKVEVDGETFFSVAEGNGPVNALDCALRKDLGKYQEKIIDMELVDYKVRILNGGTGAITRVLVDSTDSSGHHWTTIGVSDNIIDASFQALTDAINYKLIRTLGTLEVSSKPPPPPSWEC